MRIFARLDALLMVMALLGASSGCKKEEAPAKRFSCRCAFLTDMDDASEQRVEVCATDASRAEPMAIGCAQSGAPATVQRCACEPTTGPPCDAGDCKVHEFR